MKEQLFRVGAVIALLAPMVFSQAGIPDDEDLQSWNDLQINVALGKQVDYFNRVTMRIGDNVSNLRDGRFQVGVAWRPTSALTISPFFWYIKARNTAGRFRIENRLNLAVSYRFPVKKVGLIHRSTFEKRLRRPVNTWRYRGMITIEKEIPKTITTGAKVFVSDEVFYDSATSRFSRNRFGVGISKTISKQSSVDLSYVRQNDGFSRPGDLHIIWSAWRIKF
jgi:hypothetical protein